ncbi:MAG: MATE family efflux transporter [Spirochaetaceae bacterium 4572_7]|nr:MAG: MATE family efflux transporter [Spirochaetaceae bacterium 4572_7]
MKKNLLFLILSMSIPAILEMLLNTMLGLSDTIMISRFIGKEALTSVGFANQIIFALIFIFSTFNTGAVAMVSRALGEKDYVKLKKISEQNVNINLLISIIILFLGYIFNKQIFRIFDIPEQVYNDTIEYFNIVQISLIPMFLSFSFAANLRGAGNTLTPMIITGIATVINIIGNFVLILGLGPFPALGIAGAAWATTGSRYIALFIYIYIIYIKESNIRLEFKFFFDKNIVKPLWNISLPGAIEQTLMQTSFVVIGVIVSQLETVSEAGYRILIQIESISFMPAVGMSIAAATLVGKSLGEKDINKASKVGYLSSGMGMIWGVIVGIFFILFPDQILSIFTKEIDVINKAVPVMFFIALNQIGLNFIIVISGALRGAGDTKGVMINTILRLWLVFVPFSYVSIVVLNLGIVGVWYAEILSFTIFATALFFRFRSKTWAILELTK